VNVVEVDERRPPATFTPRPQKTPGFPAAVNVVNVVYFFCKEKDEGALRWPPPWKVGLLPASRVRGGAFTTCTTFTEPEKPGVPA
jgi:hypothetical protein